MKNSTHNMAFAMAAAGLLTLAACGGGGGGGGGNGSVVTTGVVAGGAPVANGSGYVMDASAATAAAGKTVFTTDANGVFNVDLTGKNGPFLYHLNGVTSGGTPVDLYSIANASQAAGRVNITPLTSLVLGYASGASGAQLESSCTATWSGCAALLNGVLQNVGAATTTVVNAVPANVYSQFGLTAGTFNPFSTSFTANHTGVDGLLDAITVSPPASNAGNFTVTLNSTGASILTVPTTGTPGTQASGAPTPTAPTTAQAAQGANMAKAMLQIEARVAAFNALFANSLPTSSQISAFLTAGFLYDGANQADFSTGIINPALANYYAPVGTKFLIGGLAPYSGAPYAGSAPASNVTFDGNQCVSSLWVYSGRNGFVSSEMNLVNVGQDSSCNGGTWSFAGNGRQFAAYVAPSFFRIQLPTPVYRSGLNLVTLSAQAALSNSPNYTSVNISGPGITTKGSQSATTGSVDIARADPSLSATNTINDSFYGATSLNAYSGLIEGTNQLLDCALMTVGANTNGNWDPVATLNSPCLNSSAAKAGSDYVITVKDSQGATIEKFMHRLAVAPTTSIPVGWYPTITSITPAGNTVGHSGGTAALSWTLPSAAQAVKANVNVNDAGIRTLRNAWNSVGSTATTTTLVVGTLPNLPNPNPSALTGLPAALSSYGFVTATINGVVVISGIAY